MAIIHGSVGFKGKNDKKDVKAVQHLLNKRPSILKAALSVDGICGKKTIEAIKLFQSKVVGLKWPDGRVDPGGRTFRKLNTGSDISQKLPSQSQQQMVPKIPKPSPQSRKTDREERRKFVNSKVKEIPKTTKIIDAIHPHFKGVGAKVISGYLNDSDRFWKINYHWEYLVDMIEHSLKLNITQKHKSNLTSIKSNLMSCKPNPERGYILNGGKIGYPVDKSSMKEMDKRVKIVRQSKRDYKKIVELAELQKKSNRSSYFFKISLAPVAHPGKSKHGTGYALDIKWRGKNRQIVSICKKLGATLTFDEDSHVHVEFKNGVFEK